MKKLILAGALATAIAPFGTAVRADSIDPATFSATLAPGESVTVRKTYTIDSEPPVDAPLDVMFLFDTTGSMGPVIDAARLKATDILTGLGAFGDLATGVATYRDFPVSPYGSPGDSPFTLAQDLGAGDTAATIAGPALAVGGGNDTPESGLFALSSLASATSWRPDSSRFVIHLGDAPFHDGILEPAYPDVPDTGLDEAIAALNAEGITWVGLDFDSGFSRMDDTGQATALAGATGGSLFDAALADPDAIAAAIIAAVEDIISTYSTVSVSSIGAGPEIGVGVECVTADGVDCAGAGGTVVGDWDRSATRDFVFDVTFTGLEKTEPHGAVKSFVTVGSVDGLITARELDDISVVPEPATLALLGLGLAGLGATARRRAAA